MIVKNDVKRWILAVILLAVFALAACSRRGDLAESSGESPALGPVSGTGPVTADTEPDSGDMAEEGPESASETAAWTVMVYMIGSDLESQGGTATEDLEEMLAADTSDRLNLVIQTGGAFQWQSELTGTENTCRRFVRSDNSLYELEDLSTVNMAEPGSLAGFIRFAAEQFPAERYSLILWDHGAGTVLGYGMDENFEGFMLEIGELRQALESSGVHFSWIGFDACLMGTLEVASALESSADYLIASEETEPAGGWAYSPFLSLLSDLPDISLEELGQRIVDDFVHDPQSTEYDNNTLAVLDLGKVPALRRAVAGFLESEWERLQEDYETVVKRRSRTRSFGGGYYEQVDLEDLLEQAGAEEERPDTAAVRKALEETVVCFDSRDARSGGLALYFPYLFPDRYEEVAGWMTDIGFDESYFAFFDRFLTTVVAEQERASLTEIPAGVRAARWYRPEEISLKEGIRIEPANLKLKEGEVYGSYASYISLPAEQWDLIRRLDHVVYADTAEFGRLELGSTQPKRVYPETGDICYDYDGTWLSLADRIVPYYEMENPQVIDGQGSGDAREKRFAVVPAEVNGRLASILLCRKEGESAEAGTETEELWDVLGYRREEVLSNAVRSSAERISAGLKAPDRGVHPFVPGDEIRFYAYRDDGSRADIYPDPLVYHEEEGEAPGSGMKTAARRPVEEFLDGSFFSVSQEVRLDTIFRTVPSSESEELVYDASSGAAEGSRIVLSGTIDTYSYDELLAMPGQVDYNYGADRNRRFRLIILDTPKVLRGRQDVSSIAPEVSLINAGVYSDSGMNFYETNIPAELDGQHITFSVPADGFSYSSDTGLPFGAPSIRGDVRILR